jgi:hypothetical protein
MSSNSIPLRPPMTRDAAGTLLGQTMGLVAVTAGVFAVGAYLGRNLAYQWGWLLFIARSSSTSSTCSCCCCRSSAAAGTR